MPRGGGWRPPGNELPGVRRHGWCSPNTSRRAPAISPRVTRALAHSPGPASRSPSRRRHRRRSRPRRRPPCVTCDAGGQRPAWWSRRAGSRAGALAGSVPALLGGGGSGSPPRPPFAPFHPALVAVGALLYLAHVVPGLHRSRPPPRESISAREGLRLLRQVVREALYEVAAPQRVAVAVTPDLVGDHLLRAQASSAVSSVGSARASSRAVTVQALGAPAQWRGPEWPPAPRCYGALSAGACRPPSGCGSVGANWGHGPGSAP